jgi:hypothetical protein
MKNEDIGWAAMAAAAELVGDDGRDLEASVFPPSEKPEFPTAAAAYLKIAPTASPEDVLRFGAAKGLHLLPADGWATLDASAKLFFEAFTFAAKGLIAGFAPPARSPAAGMAPMRFPAPAGDDIYDRVGEAPPPIGETTAGMSVTPAAASPREAPYRPGAQEFMAMSPEERRAFAGVYGFPSILDEVAADRPLIDSVAPAAARVIGAKDFETVPGEAATPSSGPSGHLPPRAGEGKKRRR